MTYGYEDPAIFPVVYLYDSNMINMYINAAREQYTQNRQEMKEFQKLYGDFYSPSTADMDYVDRQTRGRINDAMAYMQQNGIDPLRSAEGRAMIQRIINTTPTGEIAKRQQSAKVLEEYLKNKAALQRANKYNDDFEQGILGYREDGTPITVENWDTSRDGVWMRPSPNEYQDLNQYTEHIFDDLKDSFIETKDGLDWYGVTRDQMAEALTPQLGGLLNNELGRFHYENARKDLQAMGVENPTDAQVMQQFKDNILTANRERTRLKFEENAEYKRQREHQIHEQEAANQFRRQLALENAKNAGKQASGRSGSRSRGSGSGDGEIEKDWWRDTFNSSIANAASNGPLQYDYNTVEDYYDQISSNLTGTQSGWSTANETGNLWDTQNKYINHYSFGTQHGNVAKWLDRKLDDNGAFQLKNEDFGNLYTPTQVVTNTYGWNESGRVGPWTQERGVVKKNIEGKFAGADIIPTDENYGALDKNGTMRTYNRVRVKPYNIEVDDKGKEHKVYGAGFDAYYDLEINSQPGKPQKKQVGTQFKFKRDENGNLLTRPTGIVGTFTNTNPYDFNRFITEDVPVYEYYGANVYPEDTYQNVQRNENVNK